jgi:hypothetical protein
MTIKLEPGENLSNIKLRPIPPKFEDLDLNFLKTVSSSLKVLDTEERERILGALNFLCDALAAHTTVQSYLTIYGGLNFLTSGVGQQRNTLSSDDMALREFMKVGVIDPADVTTFENKFQHFHTRHYKVLKGNKVKKQELDEIKAFFKVFLAKYIEYGKVKCQQE